MPPAVELVRLRAWIDPGSLVERKLRVEVEAALLRLSREGLVRGLPPDAPIGIDRITPDRAHLRLNIKGLSAALEMRPVVSAAGRLRLELISVRAGFLPIPLSIAHAAIGRWLPSQPGLHAGEGNEVEIDLGEVLALVGVTLPPLQAARA